ncbi:MAG: DegT/DnrJ/EryC1/StrS family aminotransferase [Acidimicrobiia bacterium]|nr:MAG: DegT/DnrJ/EryC1/StrS family aminotransferase [Acidimicrobiia bacterium]
MSDERTRTIGIASPEITTAEEEAVLRVLRSGRLAQGPEVAAFETAFKDLQHASHVVATSNGTTALQTALHIQGIKAGDEVLVPAFTFAASANAVVATGATPVFVDIADNWLIDLGDAEAKITPRTRAVMPVHLYGLMADMVSVRDFSERHGLVIVEDAAQAHLARRGGIWAGTAGVGAFSFYATKNAMTGEGGTVTTQTEDLAEAARRFRNHGMTTRYTHVEWGLNLRMTELQAAIGTEQLKRLESWTAKRRASAAYFDENLPGLFVTPTVPADAFHVYHQYTTSLPSQIRDHVLEEFTVRGIGADVYYTTPVPVQQAFEGSEAAERYPRATAASRSILNLPIHHQLSDTDLERIVTAAHEISETI